MIVTQQTQTAEETRAAARELYLTHQRSKVVSRLKASDNEERLATIRQINGFLYTTSPQGRIFWLKVRREIERQIEENS
jgi:hypothetical protein